MLLSRDGQYMLTGGDGGVVSVWQVHDLKRLFTYPGCDAGIRSMAMSHDQRYRRLTGSLLHSLAHGSVLAVSSICLQLALTLTLSLLAVQVHHHWHGVWQHRALLQ